MPLCIPHKHINGVEHKWCNICKGYKALNKFSTNKSTCDGLQTRCGHCRKNYYSNNRMKSRKRSSRFYYDNKEHYVKVRKKYYTNNINAYRIRGRKSKKKLREENPAFKFKDNARKRIRTAFKRQGLQKNISTVKLICSSITKLRHHIEKQFTEYMNEKNGWHIDHRIPCAAFNLKNPVHQKVCFWYKNLQPMWAMENIIKRDKYKEEDKQALIKEWIFYHI